MKAEYLPEGSPDCPIVRLFEFDDQEALLLQLACVQLAKGEQTRFDLTGQTWCESVGEFRLLLTMAAKDFRLRLIDDYFEWAITRERWSDVAALIDPFTKQQLATGYQWLDEGNGVSLLLSPSGRW